MAITVLYTQDFALGSSTFTSINIYNTAHSPNPDTDAVDPLYPEVVAAEAMTISGGKADCSLAGSEDYSTAGIVLKDFPTFDGTAGSIECTYTPNATSIAQGFYHLAISIRDPTSNGVVIEVGVVTVGSPHTVELLVAAGWFPTADSDQTVNYPFVAGTDYTFLLEWQCGTVTGAFVSVAADGWVRLSINGVVVLSVTGYPLFIDDSHANEVRQVWFGYYGLLGPLDHIVLSSGHADPPPQFTFHNAELIIGLTWIILTTRTGAQYVWADRPLPDPDTYYLGWKEPRALAWGKITRALSNVLTGQYENAVFTVDLDDTDRLLRGLDDDRELIGASVVVYMITDVGRRALETPKTVFRGTITEAKPTATLRYSLTMKDPYAEQVASQSPAPMRVFNQTDFPNCAQDKVPCSAEAYLVNGAVLAGVDTVLVDTGHGVFAPGALITFAGHATVYTISTSLLSEPETTITFTPVLTANVADNEAITVTASFTVPIAIGRRVPVPYGWITDRQIVGGIDAGDGQGPVVYVGDRVLSDGKTYGEFIWSAAACYSGGSPASPFEMLYVWNNDMDGAYNVYYGAVAVPIGTLATEAGAGGRIAIPGYANWSTLGYTTTYVDLNSRRYTRLFLRGIFRDWALGILKAPDNLGGVPFAVNAYGCETVGDGTGSLIHRGLPQYLHVLQNWLPPVGDCYQTGAWKTTPLYPDTTPMIDEASFAAADAQSGVYVTGGFQGDFILFANNDPVSARDLVARLNLSFAVQSGFNNQIQFCVQLVNTDLGSTTLVDPLGYERDIFAGTFTIDATTRELFTAIAYKHTQDYLSRVQDGWRSTTSGVTETENTTATSDYGAKTTYQTLTLYMLRGKNRSSDSDAYLNGTLTITAVLALTLARVSAIQHLPTLGTGPAGMNYELGDVVPITHYEGLSTAGWTARPVRIERVEIDPSQFISGLEGYDLDPLL